MVKYTFVMMAVLGFLAGLYCSFLAQPPIVIYRSIPISTQSCTPQISL